MFESRFIPYRPRAIADCSIGFAAIVFLMFIDVSTAQPLRAQESESRLSRLDRQTEQPPIVESWRDDVHFHDVHSLGHQLIWSVGDRGTIWASRDGGASWSIIPCPTTATLNAVQFLTDRVGWVAGGEIEPHTRVSRGVILETQNGGESWREISQGSLPWIADVRFFTLQQGIVVGRPNAEHPTGILMTSDGGKTWQDAPGPPAEGWLAADFLNPDLGVVAGLKGQVSLVGEGRLMQPQLGRFGLRGIRAVRLSSDETGWMVGDGGLMLHTDNGGVVWKKPATGLPDEVAQHFDFRAVAGRDRHLWIAGSPGSVIWHSPDGGHTWERQLTGQTVPLSSLSFSDAQHGVAAGALGLVLGTDDGGRTWRPLRGGDRRVALLQLGGREDELSMALVAKFSGELGYRSVSILPIRRDYDPASADGGSLEQRLQQAVIAAGGNDGELGWQLPVDAPDLERTRTRLNEVWNLHTEGHLDEVLMRTLVGSLRAWRPNVVVISQPSDVSEGTRILQAALLRAVPHAADPTYLVNQQEITGLSAWRVDRVYQREQESNVGHDRLDMSDYLPRWGKSLALAAAPASSLLTPTSQRFQSRADAESFRAIYRAPSTLPVHGGDASDRIFGGMHVAPGSAARRELTQPDEETSRKQQQLAKQQRNFHAIARRLFDDPRQAAQVLSQVRTVMSQWSAEAAVAQLSQLADEYGRRHAWDLTEATYVELVQRYPAHPLAADAMKWLIAFWSSRETAWQRSRKTEVTQVNYTVAYDQLLEQIERARQVAQVNPRRRDELPPSINSAGENIDLGETGEVIDEQLGALNVGLRDEWRGAAVRNWQTQALKLAHLMHRVHPQLYQTAEIQFSLAALLRDQRQHQLADTLYRRQRHRSRLDPLDGTRTAADLDVDALAAAGEIWLVQPSDLPPKGVYACSQLDTRPELDGQLTDACWQQASEVYLNAPADDQRDLLEKERIPDEGQTLVFVAYDREYLYLAASVEIRPELPDDPPVYPGRLRDSNLHPYDRLSFYLDVDRDFATAYELHVDQRGWTGEACAADRSWDPTWYVAAERDESRWRIECAIPWEELVPTPPAPGEVWNLRIARTIPAHGIEYWPPLKKSSQSRAAMHYGFLRF